MDKQITVLAHDPGTKSYGVCVIKAKRIGKRLKITVLDNGKIEQTVSVLKRRAVLDKQTDAYLHEVGSWFVKYRPDFYIAERYMSRLIRGTLIECVAYMLAVVILTMRRKKLECRYTLVPAVIWKNWAKRLGIDLKAWYKETRTTPHQVDAMMMGVYAAVQLFKIRDPKINMRDLITQLEDTSRIDLKRKRK
jgi:Holliday junction resolvasome RuvABC endonuclease subunit